MEKILLCGKHIRNEELYVFCLENRNRKWLENVNRRELRKTFASVYDEHVPVCQYGSELGL